MTATFAAAEVMARRFPAAGSLEPGAAEQWSGAVRRSEAGDRGTFARPHLDVARRGPFALMGSTRAGLTV